MIRLAHLRNLWLAVDRSGWRDDRAAQLVEFAVSLPLLVLFVVGIFDFSNAFTLKQKLTNVARDAARAAAAEPASDLQSPIRLPMSVMDAFQNIDNYLLANNLSDCGVLHQLRPPQSGLTWTYQGKAASCPPGGLTIIINRGYYFPANGTVPLTAGLHADRPGRSNCSHRHLHQHSVCVSLEVRKSGQPYRRNLALLDTITATAVAMNEN